MPVINLKNIAFGYKKPKLPVNKCAVSSNQTMNGNGSMTVLQSKTKYFGSFSKNKLS